MSSLHSSNSNLLSALCWLLTGERCLCVPLHLQMHESAYKVAHSCPGLDVSRSLCLCDLLRYIILKSFLSHTGSFFNLPHTSISKANLDKSRDCPLTPNQRNCLSFIFSRYMRRDCFYLWGYGLLLLGSVSVTGWQTSRRSEGKRKLYPKLVLIPDFIKSSRRGILKYITAVRCESFCSLLIWSLGVYACMCVYWGVVWRFTQHKSSGFRCVWNAADKREEL